MKTETRLVPAKWQTYIRISLVLTCLSCMIVSCSSIPKRTPSSQPDLTPSSTTSSQQREVETQLLRTLADARKLGPANPLLLSTMYSLADFYREHQNYTKAETVYQEALALKEHSNGLKHPDVASILEKYASLLREAGRKQDAIQLEHRALAIRGIQTTPKTPPP